MKNRYVITMPYWGIPVSQHYSVLITRHWGGLRSSTPAVAEQIYCAHEGTPKRVLCVFPVLRAALWHACTCVSCEAHVFLCLLCHLVVYCQTWTMILEFNDTPEGLVVDVEVIAGGFRVRVWFEVRVRVYGLGLGWEQLPAAAPQCAD